MNTTSETAYPLYWPEGRKRTSKWDRERARFDCTFAIARDELVAEIYRLCGKWPDPKIVISTNINLRRDGLPLAGQRAPDDPGVAVYFVRKDRRVAFACDRWQKVEHNMRAISRSIEAMRGIERWGTGDMLEAAINAFVALPAPAAAQHWRDVLGFHPASRVSADDVRRAYRERASKLHPDKGGTDAAMAELNRARDQALMECA